MPNIPLDRIKRIKSFPSLVKFLRDDLDWPLSSEEIDELVFEYKSDELGIDPKIAVKIKEIKQLRPLVTNQPWGIFYIGFEPKRLPVVVLRRILQKLVIKKRQSAESAYRNAWKLHDLLFISSYGEENQRAITFAHFSDDEENKLPTLRVIGWDSQDTPLHMDRCINELESLTFDEELSPDDWRQKWSKAFTLRHREVISTSKSLAVELAALATRIRQRVNKVIAVESEKGPMRQLYKAFKETLVHDLSKDDFADMYAQTITYGLFSTKKSRPAGLAAENLLDMIPKTNPFLKELLSTFLTVGGRKGKIDFDELGIDDVVQTLRNTDMDAVVRDFEDRNPLEDPVIHFYEGFLKEYDAKKKVKRGVFYTPRPVVSFIVRSVDEILRKDFGLEYGLADTTTWGEMQKKNKDIKIPEGVSEKDPFVQILDPAAGTGTFLVEVIALIYKTMTNKWESQGHMPLEFDKLWNEYVPKYLLPRLYGFELMMAPYAIAHMKIGLKLFETGYRFGSDKRARIYLTNSLEPPKDFPEYLEDVAKSLAFEAHATNVIKSQVPINIVIGNPPYSAISSNLSAECRSLVDDYRYLGGEKIRERSMLQFEKNIQDDYIKFIAFAQRCVKSLPEGIVAFVTNHSYLDAPTLRGMRDSLLDTYSRISLLDLHGSATKGEISPDGQKDENVFDIRQGTAIFLMYKTLSKTRSGKSDIRLGDLWGRRDNKYKYLISSTISNIYLTPIQPKHPYYFFVNISSELEQEWESASPISEVLKKNLTGTTTGLDSLLLDFDRNTLIQKIKRFIDNRVPEEDIILEHKIQGGHGALLLTKRKDFDLGNADKYLKRFQVAPFDFRWGYMKKDLLQGHRFGVMENLGPGRIGLVATRQTKEKFGVYVIDGFCGHKFISAYDRSYVFPLWDCHFAKLKGMSSCETFLSKAFLDKLRTTLQKNNQGKSSLNLNPDNVFCYLYAVLNASSYSSRFQDRLKREYPRVPIISNVSVFSPLQELGKDLVALHLMESKKLNSPITTFPVRGNNAVTKVGENGKTLTDVENGKGKLFINKTQYFGDIPEDIWNFQIGAHQVCRKWLADRKKAGRKLSADDIEHYHKIVVALSETIKIMNQIDETIDTHGGWPIE